MLFEIIQKKFKMYYIKFLNLAAKALNLLGFSDFYLNLISLTFFNNDGTYLLYC